VMRIQTTTTENEAEQYLTELEDNGITIILRLLNLGVTTGYQLDISLITGGNMADYLHHQLVLRYKCEREGKYEYTEINQHPWIFPAR